ncbi:MAG: ROK family protein [Actinobacteria bacterium]|nr:ROK family protein [Actinomycetota bacterium]
MDGWYVGIETGGTKVVAAVAAFEDGRPVLAAPETVVPTGHDPHRTWDAVRDAVGEAAGGDEIAGVGIASFGPVNLRAGRMGPTPKRGWAGFPLVEECRARLDAPVAIDTDVNAAALAEWRWGAAGGADVAAYLTIGTGVGGGLVANGGTVRGLQHPEIGHLPVPRMPGDDHEGTCGAHVGCWEGMTAGPSLRRRYGIAGEDLPDDHEAWDLVAWYVGTGLSLVTLAWSPEVIVVGGGVMARGLHDRAAARMVEALDGYVPAPRVEAPHFGARAGLYGAFLLARSAAGSGLP